jgi:predicted CXXCH cytochrome family protein
MVHQKHLTSLKWPLITGSLVGLLAMLLTIGMASAAPLAQDAQPTPTAPAALEDQDCKDCHLDIANTWSKSPHAHAFDDPYFQERWAGMGNTGECLLCHTTNYQASDNSYTAEGVSCEACHGKIEAGHPPSVAPIRADTEYCGACHTTTLHEWRLTGHASGDVGCMDCHDPHSQDRLFEVSDDLCINCHKEDMQRYLEDLHIQKNIGCVDCHALVIPPVTPPDDGIVPTGHTFTITPATCVACHTDALHAGFSLPGFENGAAASVAGAITETITGTTPITNSTLLSAELARQENGLSNEQRIQALETSLASRQLSTLFQGGIIGLVLGGSTAWFVAQNARRTRREGGLEDEHEVEIEADDETENL